MLAQIIEASWLWGLIASILFTGILIVHHVWGPGPKVRDENGKRQKVEPRYRTILGLEMLAMVSSTLVCAFLAIDQLLLTHPDAGALTQFGTAYSVFFIINLWDLVVIDWALVVRFRPKWLILPDTAYFNTVSPHAKGWVVGNLYILPIAGLAYLLTIWG
ncbi:MAG: hypothetical protein O3B41_08870 [Bacteroidetes bacterium]|nr:hypothetical protein [Bacteroidota bacterium]